jgi:hypothetical protein
LEFLFQKIGIEFSLPNLKVFLSVELSLLKVVLKATTFKNSMKISILFPSCRLGVAICGNVFLIPIKGLGFAW